MNKKNGFTLIELMAVIVILAIIALITVPIIMNIISKASKEAFRDSAYGIIKAGEFYYAEKEIETGTVLEETSFIFPNSIEGLEISGSIPTSGMMMINELGEIEIAISNGKLCARKGYNETEVKLDDNIETCTIGYEIKIEDIEISSNDLEVNVGETKKLEVEIKPSNATNKVLEYISSDEEIVKVDSEGNVTGLKAGEITVTVKTTDETNITKGIKVTVIQKSTSLEVNTDSVSLMRGDTYKIEATILPEDTSDKRLKWTSIDESIATVDESGKITGISAGTTKITVETQDGTNLSKEIEVTVRQQVESLELDKTSVTLYTKERVTVNATVLPDNAYLKAIKWLSSDENVVTVEGGVIIGIKAGNAEVTASTIDGSNITKKITITVLQKATDISLSKTSTTLTRTTINPSETISATVTPTDTSNKGLTWTSSNTGVATVDTNGKITGVKAGSATITVKTNDGSNISKTIAVTVTQRATSITTNTTSVTVDKGKTATVTTTIVPTNANNKNVTWKSNNTNIATVNNGVITGVNAGSTTVTVTTADGSNLSKTINVTVNKVANTIITTQNDCLTSGTCANGTKMTIKVNASESYNFYVIKDDGTNLTLIMDSNLGGTVAWINEADYNAAGGASWSSVTSKNDKGPLTAIKALEDRTSGWTNIPMLNYTYIDDGGGNRYSPITRNNIRARLLTKTEAHNLECGSSSSSCPTYLYITLDYSGPKGYWLSAAESSVPSFAWIIHYSGVISNPNGTYASSHGVRPVITIQKLS